MKTLLKTFALLAIFTAGITSASAENVINLTKKGLAIKGYDPVAYQTENKAVKGKSSITATHAGATYQFSSEEHKALFQKNPVKYAPAYGGYCAYGVSIGKLFKINPKAFSVHKGRLLLQYDKGVAKKFSKDLEGGVAKADANWPALSVKK